MVSTINYTYQFALLYYMIQYVLEWYILITIYIYIYTPLEQTPPLLAWFGIYIETAFLGPCDHDVWNSFGVKTGRLDPRIIPYLGDPSPCFVFGGRNAMLLCFRRLRWLSELNTRGSTKTNWRNGGFFGGGQIDSYFHEKMSYIEINPSRVPQLT